MKPKYNKTYKSFLSTQKRKMDRSEALFVFVMLKQMFCKSLGIPYRD